MLDLLLKPCTCEEMREVVLLSKDPAKITELIKEMQSNDIKFTQEIINSYAEINPDELCSIANKTPEILSAICYKRLRQIAMTNPIIAIRINQILKMFEANDAL